MRKQILVDASFNSGDTEILIDPSFNSGDTGLFGLIFVLIFVLALCAVLIISMWKIFVKAGRPGWAALIPFYNSYCEFDIAFGTGWMFLLGFIPCVNFVVMILLYFKLAKVFGKGTGFGFGLLFLPMVFFPILAFGDAEYDISN